MQPQSQPVDLVDQTRLKDSELTPEVSESVYYDSDALKINMVTIRRNIHGYLWEKFPDRDNQGLKKIIDQLAGEICALFQEYMAEGKKDSSIRNLNPNDYKDWQVKQILRAIFNIQVKINNFEKFPGYNEQGHVAEQIRELFTSFVSDGQTQPAISGIKPYADEEQKGLIPELAQDLAYLVLNKIGLLEKKQYLGRDVGIEDVKTMGANEIYILIKDTLPKLEEKTSASGDDKPNLKKDKQIIQLAHAVYDVVYEIKEREKENDKDVIRIKMKMLRSLIEKDGWMI